MAMPDVSEEDVKSLLRALQEDEQFAEWWDRLYKKTEPEMISDLTGGEVRDRLLVMWYSDTFKVPILRELLNDDLALRVSFKRGGRREAVQALTGMVEEKARRILSMKKAEG